MSRFTINLARRTSAEAEIVIVEANGAPAVLVLTADATVLLVPEFDGALIRRIELITAPEKLESVDALFRGS